MASVLRLLSNSWVVLGLTALLVFYILIAALVNYRKLRQFKGPPFAAFSRWWLFWEECRARLPHSQFAVIEKYGSPARLGPDLLVTNDIDLIRHINAPGSRWTRSGWYDAMKMDTRSDNVFSTRDEKHHADLKAREYGGYTGRDIATLEPDVDARCVDLVDLIRTTYNGVSMDFSDIARFFTLDVLSTVAFGRPFGFMAANEDLWQYQKTSSEFMFLLGLSANHLTVRRIIYSPIMQALAAPKATDKYGIGPALGIARDAIAERFGPNAKVRKDMLGWFIEKGLSQVQCEVEAFLQIIAGSDSTTTVLRSTIFLLASTPSAYLKLRSDIDAAVNAGEVSSPVIKYTEALKIPYLKACIWEGLRLYPPLFGLKAKCAPIGGETFKGVFYPEGSEVCICDDAVFRNKEVFGEDSHFYRPERFLENEEELNTRRMKAVDVVFGSGRFACLGRHIATMQLHKSIAELIRNFDFSIADPMRGIDTTSHNVHMQSNMNIIARPRSV